jgi:hypothetical protein
VREGAMSNSFMQGTCAAARWWVIGVVTAIVLLG